jgi:hypothetical protein
MSDFLELIDTDEQGAYQDIYMPPGTYRSDDGPRHNIRSFDAIFRLCVYQTVQKVFTLPTH